MATWIFQCNPERYLIREALKTLDEIRWLVSQHRDLVSVGDTVYLWQSGASAGIVARGRLTALPKEGVEASEEASLYVDPNDALNSAQWRATIAVEASSAKPCASSRTPPCSGQTPPTHPAAPASPHRFDAASAPPREALRPRESGVSMGSPEAYGWVRRRHT